MKRMPGPTESEICATANHAIIGDGKEDPKFCGQVSFKL
jgi:hypothetical protein